MEDEQLVEDETLEVQDEPEEDLEEVEDDEEEDTTDWKAEAQKAKELADNYKIRAEKAEKKPKGKSVSDETGLSTKDLLALSKANIETDDLDEVLDYAKYKKLSIHEVLDSPVLKATLAEKAELRKSAAVVSTGTGRRAGTTASDERILSDASKGIMPSSDTDLARLTKLRLQNKK